MRRPRPRNSVPATPSSQRPARVARSRAAMREAPAISTAKNGTEVSGSGEARVESALAAIEPLLK